MSNSEKYGCVGERCIQTYLHEKLKNLDIVWTRKTGRTNAPFDFEIYDDFRCICQIEVRTLTDERKNYEVAFTKPQLTRKEKRNAEMGYPQIFTVLVKLNMKTEPLGHHEFRQAEGLPSKYFEYFSPDMDEMINAIEKQRTKV